MNKQPTRKQTISNETKDIIKKMMNSQKLSMRQQKILDEYILEQRALPAKADVISQPVRNPPKKQILNGKVKRHIRTFDQIASTGAYHRDVYVPSPVVNRETEKEKLLASLLGDKYVSTTKSQIIQKPAEEEEIDEFDMCTLITFTGDIQVIDEIAERKQFLDEMNLLGCDAETRKRIITEISLRAARLEKLHKQNSADL